MSKLWGREPALVLGAVNAVLAVLIGFGAPVTPAQVGLVNAAVAAVLSLLVRQQVTPVTKPSSETGAITLTEVCLVVLAIVAAAWALGYVPK